MLLTSMLITAACQNVTAYSNHEDACNKFFEVSTQKIGLYQGDEKVENYITGQAQNEANNYLGVGVEKVGVGTFFAYKVYKNKAVDFKIPTMGMCDTATNHVTTNSYSLNLTWKFPWLK